MDLNSQKNQNDALKITIVIVIVFLILFFVTKQ